jgi:MOSC domain-containing protein YiiM
MKTYDELQALWRAVPRSPAQQGVVKVISLRLGGGRHRQVKQAELTVEAAVVGDRWSLDDDPERLAQVTFMSVHVADCIGNDALSGYEAGDNFYVDLDLSEEALPVGARVALGGAVLEVSPEPHLGCRKFRHRFGEGALRFVNHKEKRALRLRGVNLRVVEAGPVKVGDSITVAVGG